MGRRHECCEINLLALTKQLNHLNKAGQNPSVTFKSIFVTDKSAKITPVILAGGKGQRLWPMSRSVLPKQFLKILSEYSLFQQTLLRFDSHPLYNKPVIITNNDYRFLVAEQAEQCGVKPHAIILEPIARDTAPAIIAATSFLNSKDPKTILHVLPSDHYIGETNSFFLAIENALLAAQEKRLVTFGIKPTEPATGFGYIEAEQDEEKPAYPVIAFYEKPDEERARKFIQNKNFYWNSGMFMFRTDVLLIECKRLVPDIHNAATSAVSKAKADLDFFRLDEESFSKAPTISIDYAIFEKAKSVSVVPSSFEWSDLGSWDAIWKMGDQDEHQNVGIGPVTLNNTKNSLVLSEKMHVAVNGLDDAVIVLSEDAAYVGKLSEAQSVGDIVKRLQQDESTQDLTKSHLTNYRPWGGYSSILKGERFQVKRLFVKPGKRLSLQKHHHRAEHWIVVSGTADVQIDDNHMTLSENQSTYIPQGSIHRLSNSGKILLEIIEIQTGSYLEEDDIIRIEDEFGRI